MNRYSFLVLGLFVFAFFSLAACGGGSRLRTESDRSTVEMVAADEEDFGPRPPDPAEVRTLSMRASEDGEMVRCYELSAAVVDERSAPRKPTDEEWQSIEGLARSEVHEELSEASQEERCPNRANEDRAHAYCARVINAMSRTPGTVLRVQTTWFYAPVNQARSLDLGQIRNDCEDVGGQFDVWTES